MVFNRARRLTCESLESRDLLAYTAAWAAGVGGPDGDYPHALARDAAGYLYMAGTFRGTVDFAPGTAQVLRTAAGASDQFVARYAPTGTLDWVVQFGVNEQAGDTDALLITDLVADAAGRVFLTGIVKGTFTLGTSTLVSAGDSDVLIARLDPGGTVAWARHYGTTADSLSSGNYTGEESGTALALDPGGNVVVAARLVERAVSGSRNLMAVVRYDADGNQTLDTRWTGSNIQPADLTVDGSGNVYLTGKFWLTSDFDPGTGTSSLSAKGRDGYSDAFILKLTSGGGGLRFAWAGGMGGVGIDSGSRVAVDGGGNVVVAGHFNPDSRNDFDPGKARLTLANAGSADGFITSFSSGGSLLWAKSLGGPSSDVVSGLGVDGTGHVFVAGTFSGTADFDPGTGVQGLTSVGNTDGFVCQLNSSGGYVWAGQVGGPDVETIRDLALGASGELFLAGSFKGTADLDPGTGTYPLTSTPGTGADGTAAPDLFLARLVDDRIWLAALASLLAERERGIWR